MTICYRIFYVLIKYLTPQTSPTFDWILFDLIRNQAMFTQVSTIMLWWTYLSNAVWQCLPDDTKSATCYVSFIGSHNTSTIFIQYIEDAIAILWLHSRVAHHLIFSQFERWSESYLPWKILKQTIQWYDTNIGGPDIDPQIWYFQIKVLIENPTITNTPCSTLTIININPIDWPPWDEAGSAGDEETAIMAGVGLSGELDYPTQAPRFHCAYAEKWGR